MRGAIRSGTDSAERWMVAVGRSGRALTSGADVVTGDEAAGVAAVAAAPKVGRPAGWGARVSVDVASVDVATRFGAPSALVWTDIIEAWTSGGWAPEGDGSDGAIPMRRTSGRSMRVAGLVSTGGADGNDGSDISNGLGCRIVVGAAGAAEVSLADGDVGVASSMCVRDDGEGDAGVASRAFVCGEGAGDASGIAGKS